MATKLPPSPVGMPPGHSFWNDWYEKIRTIVNEGSISVLWANINFSGSNLTDLASRAHNNLQSLQGGTAGEYYHLTNTQHTRATSVISKAGLPTTSDIAAGQWAVYKDTSGGTVRLWTNDGGTMKSVTLT
jgi:hypothetical protein